MWDADWIQTLLGQGPKWHATFGNLLTSCPSASDTGSAKLSQCSDTVTPSWYKSLEQSTWQTNSSSTIKKFSAFYGTRRFITMFVTAHHLSLSWDRRSQSAPLPPSYKMHFNIILRSESMPSKCFSPSGFLTETLHAFLFSPIRATCSPHLIHLGSMILIMLSVSTES